jgi:hypothetical protein
LNTTIIDVGGDVVNNTVIKVDDVCVCGEACVTAAGVTAVCQVDNQMCATNITAPQCNDNGGGEGGGGASVTSGDGGETNGGNDDDDDGGGGGSGGGGIENDESVGVAYVVSGAGSKSSPTKGGSRDAVKAAGLRPLFSRWGSGSFVRVGVAQCDLVIQHW